VIHMFTEAHINYHIHWDVFTGYHNKYGGSNPCSVVVVSIRGLPNAIWSDL
jgi:hypothetical protein